MPTSPVHSKHLLGGAAVCLLAPAIVAVVGQVIGVARSSGPAAASASAVPVNVAGVGFSAGSLQGRDYHIAITSTPEGPRYTVRTARGELVASQLTAEQASPYFHGADPRQLVTEAPTATLMHAEIKDID